MITNGDKLVMLVDNLLLNKCPHCRIDSPNLSQIFSIAINSESSDPNKRWGVYKCASCKNLVTAWGKEKEPYTYEFYPNIPTLDNSIPDRPRLYLKQAEDSLHAPSGAIMLAASSIDAMLKEKGYTEGNLYPRIIKAKEEHLITKEMSLWAHEIRLDANDQRHADYDFAMATKEDAQKVVSFAKALAEFLFVLPSKIQRGIENANS